MLFLVLSNPQLNHNSTQAHQNINLVWLDMKITLHTTTFNVNQCQQYLSCYGHDFDETLKVGSWEHQEQITTVIVTSFKATFALSTLTVGSLDYL